MLVLKAGGNDAMFEEEETLQHQHQHQHQEQPQQQQHQLRFAKLESELAAAKAAIAAASGVALSETDSVADAVRTLSARMAASDASVGMMHEQVAGLTEALSAVSNTAAGNGDRGGAVDAATNKEIASLRQQLEALQRTLEVALPRNTSNIAQVRNTMTHHCDSSL